MKVISEREALSMLRYPTNLYDGSDSMMRVEGTNGAADWISRYKSLSKGKDGTEAKSSEKVKNRITQNSSEQENDSDIDIRTQKKLGIKECETCANRKYQDGSTDGGVSFKSPAHISPQAAPAAVRSHEQEHVSNEQAKAQNRGQLAKHGITHHQHYIGRIDAAARGLAQHLDKHHGHHDGDQHHQGGTKAAG